MEEVVVVGAGVMGSALAIHLGNNGHKVNLWGTQWDDKVLDEMKETKEHKGLKAEIPNNISFYYHDEMEEAFENTKLVIIAVISKGIEDMSRTIAQYVNEDHVVLSITKGIDEKSLNTMSTVITNNMPETSKGKMAIVKLGGGLIAAEIANGIYSEGVFASEDLVAAEYVRDMFKSPKFRGEVSDDIQGVDLCAAFKNSYAIGMGIIEGVEEGSDNPRAALMARGAIEMANIVEAYGGNRETALGVAGVGDYYVTSQGGRNGRFGKLIGQGHTKDEALEIMEHQTVEGLAITPNGYRFLRKLEEEGKINMEKDTPFFLEIYNILFNGKDVKEGIASYWEN